MSLLPALEGIVLGSVAVTARALAAVDPDVTMLQWRALVILRDGAGRSTVADVASGIGATHSATSRLLARLRARGFVASRRDSTDRRARRVRLTQAGSDVVDRVVAIRDAELATLVVPGDAGEIVRLAAAFRLLAFRSEPAVVRR